MVALIRKLMWDPLTAPLPSNSIMEETEQSDCEMSPRMKRIIAAMEEQIEEEEDPLEKKRKEELLLRFRNQIEKPYWSDNIFMELNIENLKQCYIRAQQDLKDINKFFMISSATRKEVLTIISKKGKRTDLRVQFEEKCYLTKLTQEEIVNYLEML